MGLLQDNTLIKELSSSQIINIGYSIKEMVMEEHTGDSKTNINVLSPKLGVRNINVLLLILSLWYNCICTDIHITQKHIMYIFTFKNKNTQYQAYDI